MRAKIVILIAGVAVTSACSDGNVWDADGDGFEVEGGRHGPPWDCDDSDASIHPEAEEICDGEDNDCDGQFDDDDPSLVTSRRWFLDVDRDGYGRDDDFVLACSEQERRVTTSGDCDDTSSSVHPGVAEVPYDGIDNDCADGDACDLDGDGFAYIGCATGGTDCIDDPDWSQGTLTAAMVHPGPDNETWYDGVDQDCGGGSDFDQDGDGYGCDPEVAPECASVRGTYDCRNDADVVGCGDCEDQVSAVNPGHWELPRNGVDEDCDGHVDKVVVDESPHLASTYTAIGAFTVSARAGKAILPIGDVEGDGYDDYLISAPGLPVAAGVVDLVSGSAASTVAGPRDGMTYWGGHEMGLGVGTSLGLYVDSRGVVDGYLIAGSGKVWVVQESDSISSFSPSIQPLRSCESVSYPPSVVSIDDGVYAVGDPDCGVVSTFVGPNGGDTYFPSADSRRNFSGVPTLGRALAAGDVDDGLQRDLVMTTEVDGLLAVAVLGESYGLTSSSSGRTTEATSVGLSIEHAACAADDAHPRGLAVLDFNGDGIDDIAIGCPGFDDGSHKAGAVFVVQGRYPLTDVDLADADWVFYGVGGALGATVASAGDIDPAVAGDELLVTDPESGTAYLLGHTATSGANINAVSLEFTTSYGGATINAVGVGNTNAAGGLDLVVSFQKTGSEAVSEAYLLTWGP